MSEPIVFLGPSLPLNAARAVLSADYRPPIRRGDLARVSKSRVVGIIDGVFDQQLAVAPGEIRDALSRGVRIYGASSMGALRAVEVPGVVGIGHVFHMYRDGLIDRDDEVAVIFNPMTFEPLSEPLVNIRHAVSRLRDSGTLPAKVAQRLLKVARSLPYPDRTYPAILQQAGLSEREEAQQLRRMLSQHNLKRDDALLLLEHLKTLGDSSGDGAVTGTTAEHLDAAITYTADVVHLWEFGPPVPFQHVIEFMALTGALREHAVRVASTMDIDETMVGRLGEGEALGQIARATLSRAARCWNWMTDEDAEKSLRQLGVSEDDLHKEAAMSALAERYAKLLLRDRNAAFLNRLRIGLILNRLELKRHAARVMSVQWLAERASGATEPTKGEVAAARAAICRTTDTKDWRLARQQIEEWGVSQQRADDLVTQLALAGRAERSESSGLRKIRLRPSRKVPGQWRFCLPSMEARTVSKRLCKVIGVTRVADITGLGALGLPNAQAFRPEGEWSSTVGSGKSETITGARIGAVMEEVEKWAQERFTDDHAQHTATMASFDELRRSGLRPVDPQSFDLPWDSVYRPSLKVPWARAHDLTGHADRLVPLAIVTHRRLPPDDICYSPFGARKTVTTNGLASGMTLAEALTHALCECIERHNRALDAIVHDNPGGPWSNRRATIDLSRAPGSTQRILRKINQAGYRGVVRSIAEEVHVPTFIATILSPHGEPGGDHFADGWQEASGWACHPHAETAMNMALLEASQTILSHIAGAREDLTLAARSLGRHERTQSLRAPNEAPEHDDCGPVVPFEIVPGRQHIDAATDVRWLVEKLSDSGYSEVLYVDYSRPEIRPAHVVRCLVPGLETINPFYTGRRARRALLADLLRV